MWITNVSFYDIKHGNFPNPGKNSMLIQIVDPCIEFPIPYENCTCCLSTMKPYNEFKEIHQFTFADVDNEIDIAWEFRMNTEQCASIVNLLQHAKANKMNVVVHCIAGVCRSGAVVEVGTMIGFEDLGAYRQPNVFVKQSLMKGLDLIPEYYEK